MTGLVIILFVVAFLFILYILQFKKVKLSNVFLVTGGVKTGKSFASVWLICMQYRLILFKWFIAKYIFIPLWNYALRFVFYPFIKGARKKIQSPMKPMLYSNIPLANIKYNKLTKFIIKREVRIPNKSCCFIDEASLVADMMLFKDELLNEEISLFIKLFGHYSHGGYLIYNTQDLKDMHFGFKRCTSTFLWIHSRLKLPFISILKCREMISMNDDSVQTSNNFNEDVESTCLKLIIPNKYMWYYDCYCYSALTDGKDMKVDYNVKKIKNKRFKRGDLKQKKIISFKVFKSFNNVDNDK